MTEPEERDDALKKLDDIVDAAIDRHLDEDRHCALYLSSCQDNSHYYIRYSGVFMEIRECLLSAMINDKRFADLIKDCSDSYTQRLSEMN